MNFSKPFKVVQRNGMPQRPQIVVFILTPSLPVWKIRNLHVFFLLYVSIFF